MIRAIAILALAIPSLALAQVQLPTAIAPNGTVRSTPSAIIIPSNPAVPGGPGCTLGATGCSLTTTPAAGSITTVQNTVGTSTPTNGTVAVANTYQSILAASTTRKGCLVQAGASPLLVYPGAPGSATAANSMTVGAYGTFSCNAPGLTVGDQLSVTAAALPAPYVLWVQ